MRHRVAFLLLNQHYALYLLIEKTAFAWYYVITARETNKNKQHKIKKQKEEKTMITVLGIVGVWGVVSVGVYFTLKNI